jgi:hypothetical protein
MDAMRGIVSAMLCVAMLTGCWGYTSSSKKWAYVGDSLLLVGGGAALAYGVEDKPAACTGDGCEYHSSIRGAEVVGVALLAAGLFGLLFNITRENVKNPSR